jgi:hypothetical protein
MNITYIVFTPIHGYNGMGYSCLPFIKTSFNSEEKARKWAKHCNFFYTYSKKHKNDGWVLREEYDEYYRKMTDDVSFDIIGPSKIYKRIVEEEELK